MSIESELLTLQRRVNHLEKKLKTWSRVFRQETVWKHNLEEWLIQHFDFNIRLQTELSFFKSSDDEDEPNDLDIRSATKALTKLGTKKHFSATSTSRRGSGVQIINCQANSTLIPSRESSDELYNKKRRLNSYDDGHSIDIGSTTVSTVPTHTSGRYQQFRDTVSNNTSNNNRITIQEVASKNTDGNFPLPSSSVMQTIIDPNTIMLDQDNPSYEYETEECYLSESGSRKKASRVTEEILSSQDDSEISTSNRQFSSSRTSILDNHNTSEVLVVSDDSDSGSVVLLNNYSVTSSNKTPADYTHQCTSCGRRICTPRTTFPHFLKVEETICFVCQIEQINQHQHDGDTSGVAVDSDILHSPQFGIIEILANSGVAMDAKVVKKALVKSEHWSECARLLIRNYFPREVLLHSNAKGGERKVPGGDGSRHVPLDENVVYVIKTFVKDFWTSKGGMPIEVDKGFNRVLNKVCQRERDKVKRKQNMEEQVNTSFLQQLDANMHQSNLS